MKEFDKNRRFNNKESKKFDDKKPKRYKRDDDKSSDDRPKRYKRDDEKSFNKEDRPKRYKRDDEKSYNREDRPKRYKRDDEKSYNKEDRPKRYKRDDEKSYNKEDRPKRYKRDDNDNDNNYNNDEKPKRFKREDYKRYDKEEKPKRYREDNENIENLKRKPKNVEDEKLKSYVRKKKEKEIGDDNLIRLNRYIANSGICSRRQADEFILQGFITVNGEVIKELGTKISPEDKVLYKGKELKGEQTVYVVMNKPKDYISTVTDPEDRKTVMELLQDVPERIYPVGRLDRNTTGVLLFTNDGELTKKLTHPSGNVPKVYSVTLDKDVSKNDLTRLAEGFELEDGFINADTVYYFSDKDLNRVIVEIHSGKNRIVRRMFEFLGYDVKNLDRIEFAGVTKKDLKRGQWRYLGEKEIGFLKMMAGRIKNE